MQRSDLPLTLIFMASRAAPRVVCSQQATLAVRKTTSSFCIRLIHACGVPVFSTSANRSGSPPPITFEHVDASIVQAVDLAVRSETPLIGKPSTIVDLLGDTAQVVREGSVPASEVLAALR
jgi:L-threonylcarbamoyladenylate synthase